MQVLIGGVSELFQTDLDVGRLVVNQLQAEYLGPGVVIEELHYGAVAVAQRFEDLRPATLILVSAVVRDRPPGTIERRLIVPPELSSAEVQGAVGDAVTGYVHPDLIVEIATALGLLPPRTVAVEVEPEVVTSGDGLTPCVAAVMDDLLEMVRTEVRRAPLIALANDLRPTFEDDRLQESAPTAAARELLDELLLLDREGRWGRAFSARDRLQLAIASSDSSEGMSHQDWALWWTLIEEVGRLEVAETVRRK
ncbi:MAG: hypothetical protein ACR2K2_14710 [Mycobacteriales bacterium]